MRILITGGAGFIASHVADRFVDLGHDVLVVDNLSTGKREYVPSGAQFEKLDITDLNKVEEVIGLFKPEVIDHHAAHIQVGNSVKHPQFDAENNVIGTLNVMEAGVRNSVKKVIMASTGGAMYGNQATPFTEKMKELPLSPYGISKRSAELYLNYYHEQYGIPYVALRYANVYGPRQNPHGESGVVAIFSEMIMSGKSPIINGDGSHTRDYVYVSDVVHANELALSTEYVGELNIGTGVETSTNDVFEKVTSELNVSMEKRYGEERPGEQITSSLSHQKAKEILGWEPRVTFAEGAHLVAEWYKQR